MMVSASVTALSGIPGRHWLLGLIASLGLPLLRADPNETDLGHQCSPLHHIWEGKVIGG